MKNFKRLILLVTALLSLQSYAADKPRAILSYGYDGITISIVNHTTNTCKLDYFDVKYGFLKNSMPPRSIAPGIGGNFYL